jgi:hypothetical protein
MGKFENRTTAEPAVEGTAPSKSRKSALRLEKQTIRTLTGAELKLVGGGTFLCFPLSCVVSRVRD